MKNIKGGQEEAPKPVNMLDSLADYVAYYAWLKPAAEAVVFGSRRITYLQLKKDIENCARALLANGIKKGDRVAMLSTPPTGVLDRVSGGDTNWCYLVGP